MVTLFGTVLKKKERFGDYETGKDQTSRSGKLLKGLTKKTDATTALASVFLY